MTVRDLRVTHALGSYPVTVRPGAFEHVAEVARGLWPDRPLAVITEDTVRGILAERLAAGPWAVVLSVPPGEGSKSRERWAALTDALSGAGLTRHAAIVAVGGGMVGDLAGFVAATFARGIPYLQVPTTLLAMVDSSVGGKTGVDTPYGKNLVGAFHPPAAVVADPLLLRTLPPQHLRGGLAEMAKHGLVADPAYWRSLAADAPRLQARDPEALAASIARSVEIKAAVVSEDEREAGRRSVLNAGHTVAHALEHLSRYAIPHGDAVAMGLAAEALLGEAIGVTRPGTADTVVAGLRALGLPTRLPAEFEAHQVLDAMQLDKKRGAAALRFSLLEELGRPARDGQRWTIAVEEHEVMLRTLRTAGAA